MKNKIDWKVASCVKWGLFIIEDEEDHTIAVCPKCGKWVECVWQPQGANKSVCKLQCSCGWNKTLQETILEGKDD